MAKLYNLARMTTATAGTGTITLGAAVSGYLTFALAGVANADVVDYGIKDGANSESGTGTYTSAGTTLTRTVTKSTNANAAISLSGSAEVFISPRAETLNDASLFTTGTLPVARGGTGDTGTAWTVYTPTVTAGAGTPTTVTATGRYKQIGKTVFAEMDITITTIGTATGALNATLPLNAAAFRYAGVVFEYITTGKSGAGYINGGTQPTILQSRDAAAGSWWVNGYSLAVTVTYEVP